MYVLHKSSAINYVLLAIKSAGIRIMPHLSAHDRFEM